MSSDYKNEKVFVASLKAKEPSAYNYLYDNYSASLYGIIIKIVGKEGEIANDLLQDAFVKIWFNIEKYDTQKGRLYTWMLNITRNVAIDATRSKAYKKRKRNMPMENINQRERGQQRVSEKPIEHIGLKEVIDKLDEKHKILIDLCYFEGYTQQEVAKSLDIPLGTIKSRLRKALTELKAIIK